MFTLNDAILNPTNPTLKAVLWIQNRNSKTDRGQTIVNELHRFQIQVRLVVNELALTGRLFQTNALCERESLISETQIDER